MMAQDASEILEGADLFSNLPHGALAEIETKAERLTFSLGDVISRSGDDDDSFYIVAAGKVRLVTSTRTAQNVTIAVLVPGDVFGETSIVSLGATVATARAAAQTVVLRIAGEAGRELASHFPDWGRAVAMRAASNEQLAFLRKTDLFAQFTVSQAREAAVAVQTVRLKAGAVLYEEGAPGDTCGIVYRGRLRVWRKGESGPIDLATLTRGEIVGEMALLLRCPRIASVTALEDAVVLEIDRETLARLAPADVLEKILAPIATDRLLQVQSLVIDSEKKAKPAKFQTCTLRKGIWPFARTYVGVSIDQPELAAVACIRSLDAWFGRSAERPSHSESSLAGRGSNSLDELGAELEARGYLTRLLRLNTKDARILPLPAVVRSGQEAVQTVFFISRREVISSHSAYGLLRQPAEDFLRMWDGWALSADFVPPFSGVPVRVALRRFLPLLRPFLPVGVALLAITLLTQACALVEPFFTRVIVDQVLVYKDRALLQLLILGALLATILQVAASALRAYLTAQPMNRLSSLLQVTFFRHILSLTAASTAGWDTARFLTRFEENTHILNFVSERGLGVAVDFISIFVYALAMLAFNPQLAVLALGFIVASGLLLLFSSNWLRRAHRMLLDQRARFEGFFLDTVGGIYTLKAIAAEPRVRARGMELLNDWRRFNFRVADFSNRVSAVSEALNSGATISILGYGAVLALDGKITAGQLIAFQGLMGLTLGPMLSLVGIWNDVQNLRVSLERTAEVYQLPRDITPPNAVERSIAGQVTFRNVTFYYPGRGRPAVTDISLEIQPGHKVALVGRSGSGKTTIASLMAALYEPASGAILLDGVDVREFDPQSARRQIAVIEQQPYIFNGTIRENIGKAKPTATFEEIVGAATLAGAHGFISEFPMGYDTQIGERGVTLSGGQRQRIVIARALLNQPRILILDEATSALDTESEAIVQQNLDRLMKGRTSLVIAHRLSTIRNADVIVVIDEGKIVEKGTHDDLMAHGGLYHCLYSQPA